MAQNVYDDAAFFDGYARLDRSVRGLDGAPEWPALRSMLPDVSGLRVLDLGCGYGWFSRWAVEHGAASVLGVDLSERMLDRARSSTDDDRVTYERADLDTLVLEREMFDLTFSSLTFHYLADFERLVREVANALCSPARFVFSVEHPIFTAPSAPGFVTTEGRTTWPLDGYFRPGERVTDWLAPGVVKHHRTIAAHLESLHRAGFRLTDFVEWAPDAEDLAAHPDWTSELDRPMFLLIGATLD